MEHSCPNFACCIKNGLVKHTVADRCHNKFAFASKDVSCNPRGGGGGGGDYLIWASWTCGQPGYVFRDFCLRVSILSIFVLKRVSLLRQQTACAYVLQTKLQQNFYKIFRVQCLKQGIKNRNSVLNRVGKSAVFVINRVRV